ncbi:MAG: geranylgeranyl pyrophosphate synthase [Arachnia propionica]|nr:MAG: geranylgeranyl pyrophosphate synthase [Arachnia propionica]
MNTDTLASLQERFEAELLTAATSGLPFVTEAAQHITAAGGKRFRPMLVFLASQFGGEVDEDRLLTAALAMELTHVASLYHDDVMDEAELRRATPSANARWGNLIAILVGDFLFARASRAVAELGQEYLALQAETFARLVEGQIQETVGPSEGEDPTAHYLQVLADKTGSLISASAQYGAMVAGATDEVRAALAAYGEEVGIIFQISDDLIDIVSTKTGKTPGTDLREGVATLPTLLLAASQDPADAELQALIASDLTDQAKLDRALELLRQHRVIDETRAELHRRADVARGHLRPLPAGEAKDLLLQVCDQLVDRAT